MYLIAFVLRFNRDFLAKWGQVGQVSLCQLLGDVKHSHHTSRHTALIHTAFSDQYWCSFANGVGGVEHSECKWWLKMLSGWCHPRLATHQCKHSWKLTQEVKSNFLQALFQGKSVVRPVLEKGKTRWWEYFAFLSRTLLFDLELQTNGNFWDKISGIGYFAAALNLKSKLRCVCIFSGVKSSGELSI